jgi:HTH-type transcriptional regulator, sugar sensing transcriptional regulator
LSISDRAESAMERLGLTGSEVKAYMALLSGGSMTASAVSSAARIPYSKVYDALLSLKEKGWIEEQKSRPAVYTAKPPDAAVEEMRSRQEEERKEHEKVALAELMRAYADRGIQEKPDIWIMRGTGEILSRLKNVLANCRTEMLIAFPPQLTPFTEQMAPFLTTLKEKGVKNMILTTHETPKDAVKVLSQASEVRVRPTMYGGGIISDSKEVVLLLGGGEQGSEPLAIWASHRGLARFAKEYFEVLWDSKESEQA